MARYMTVRGSSGISDVPFFTAVVQHGRTMGKKESYRYFAEKTGFAAPRIKAAFMALVAYAKKNYGRGCLTLLDGVASFRVACRGAFATQAGPWVKGQNVLQAVAVTLNPFRAAFEGIVPVNSTDGARPTINTVLDETIGSYEEMRCGSTVTAAGTDLEPNSGKDDEYVALADAKGVETKCEVTFSSLDSVTFVVPSGLAAGSYTLKIYTRSGYGDEYGVRVASRKVKLAA